MRDVVEGLVGWLERGGRLNVQELALELWGGGNKKVLKDLT